MRRARQFTEEESVDFLFYNTEMDQGGRRRETRCVRNELMWIMRRKVETADE